MRPGREVGLVGARGPRTYAYDAPDRVTGGGELGALLALDVAVTVSTTLLALALGAVTLRRRTP